MKKKLLSAILSVSLLSVMLAGCASSEADNAVDTGETDSEIAQVDGNEQLESGKVELRVWAEEADIECLQKMIDSFEQKYAGQAEFSITIEASSEADARNKFPKFQTFRECNIIQSHLTVNCLNNRYLYL